MADTPGRWAAAEGYLLLELGHPVEALAAVERETTEQATQLYVGAMVQHALGDARASDAALEALIETHQEDYAYQIAMVYGFRNEPDNAFFWLERCYELRDPGLAYMRIQRELASLHDDPRWDRLLEKIGFAE